MKTREYVFEFIQKQKTVFVGSVDEEGFPNIKAMFAPRKIEGDCFYFTTNTSSMRSQQFMKDPKAIKGRHYCNLKTESFHIADLE